MEEKVTLYQVKEWDTLYENNKSRTVDDCSFVCVPNKQHGLGFTKIMIEPDGLSIYAVWCLILGALSHQRRPRGGWMTENGKTDGKPWSISDLSLRWRRKDTEIARALEVLSSPSVCWLQVVSSSMVTNQCTSGVLPVSARCQSTDTALARNEGMKEGNSASGDAVVEQKQKSRKREKTANPNHAPAVAMWCKSWKAKYGANYTISGRDAKHIESLLKLEQVGNDLQKFQALIDSYLADDSKFVSTDRHTLGLLLSKHRSYTVAANATDPDGFTPVYTSTDRDLIWGPEGKP